MTFTTWARVKPLKHNKVVDDFETKYNFSIPSELKDCILVNNGGRPRPNAIKLTNGEEFDVKSLLSYNEDDSENIYKVITYFIGNYANELLPFASDSAGNYFCIKNKKVVLWTQDNDVFAVCDSFSQFVDSLYEF